MIRTSIFSPKGMSKDLTVAKATSDYVYDAYNIRFTVRDEKNTLMSMTNEKGNKKVTLAKEMDGTYIGHCVVNNYITVFTHDTADRIYRIDINDNDITGDATLLYEGNLGFDFNYPIETLGVYEKYDVIKTYWTDGLNQPRVINIMADSAGYTDTSFDFVQTLKGNETVSITKNLKTSGSFHSGVIQYALTYYNKYGQESNIFYISDIQYLSLYERGAAADTSVNCSFTIKIDNIDTDFDYVRIYSIQRTSLDTTPSVKNVVDLPISSKSLEYTDTGTNGSVLSSTDLLYVGGHPISAKTMTSKDNTLFFGNIKLKTNIIDQTIREKLTGSTTFTISQKQCDYAQSYTNTYAYKESMNNPSAEVLTFKSDEWYRFGVIFQHKTGIWSEACWIGDHKISGYHPVIDTGNTSMVKLCKVNVSVNLGTDALNKLKEQGFIKVKPVCVYPDLNDRSVIAQGVVNPTVFEYTKRKGNMPFSQASWFFRPFGGTVDTYPFSVGSNLISAHYGCLYGLNGNLYQQRAELTFNNISSLFYNKAGMTEKSGSFFVDQSICTFNSPEIEFDDSIQNLDISDCKFRIIGVIPIHDTLSDVSIETSSSPYYLDAPGFYKFQYINSGKTGSRQMLGAPLWIDKAVINRGLTQDDLKSSPMIGWYVCPWNKSGSLNNFGSTDKTITSKPALLSQHKSSYLRFSSDNIYLDEYYTGKIDDSYNEYLKDAKIYNFTEPGLVKLNNAVGTTDSGAVYYGNINYTILNDTKYSLYGATTGDTEFSQRIQNVTPSVLGDTAIADIKLDTDKYSRDPISMKYKSTPHAVISFGVQNMSGVNTSNIGILPKYNGLNTYDGETDGIPYWTAKSDSNVYTVIEDAAWTDSSFSAHTYEGDSLNESDFPNYILSNPTGPIINIDTGELSYNYSLYKATYSYVNRVLKSVSYASATPAQYTLFKAMGDINTTTIPPSVGTTQMYFRCDSGTTVYSISAPNVDIVTTYNIKQGGITGKSVEEGFLYLGELYIDDSDITNTTRFGGKTQQAFANNIWLPCGESVNLNETLDIIYDRGDTYYQRYDCLKTYPYTMEDENSIVDILSFMCETHINIDGRYDRNRGQTSNLTMSPSNFNLINKVYSQQDNYLSYKGLEYDYMSSNVFPSTITLTEEKQAGAKIDKWTNITVASTLDLDGDKGEITSLNKLNNEIYCFQRTGFSAILFNSRVQIPASDGTPIQITNGLKLQGKQYLSDKIGCLNKWSIAESPDGLYFMDNITNSIYCFNGKMDPLSDKLGMRSWVNSVNSIKEWNPVNMENFRSSYDKNNNDVYWTNKNYCISYSELTQQFTGFYSYENIPAMFNVNDSFYSIGTGTTLWKQWAGDYNYFYNTFRPYNITFIDNNMEPYDKIWNNLNFRFDAYSGTTYAYDKCFDTLEVWNEYQKGIMELKYTPNNISSLKKRFKVWRTIMPRANTLWNGIAPNGFDRIRSPWIYLKLSSNKEDNLRSEFYDLMINYFS